jgi:hypothetical protein
MQLTQRSSDTPSERPPQPSPMRTPPRDPASEPYTNLVPPGSPLSEAQETPPNPHFASIAWKYFKREAEEGAVYDLCRLCLDFKKEAYPYKITKGSTKSLHIHLLMQHIEPEDNRVLVVESGDQDKLFETKIEERYAPRTAYEDFLQWRANTRAGELEREGGEPGFDPISFRKKVIRW